MRAPTVAERVAAYHPPSSTLCRPLTEPDQRLIRRVADLLKDDIKYVMSEDALKQYRVRRFGKLTLLSGNLLDTVRAKAPDSSDIHDLKNEEILKDIRQKLYASRSLPDSSSGSSLVSASSRIEPYGSTVKEHAGIYLTHQQLKFEQDFVREQVNNLAGDEYLFESKPHLTILSAERDHKIQPFMWEAINNQRGHFRALHFAPVQILYPKNHPEN